MHSTKNNNKKIDSPTPTDGPPFICIVGDSRVKFWKEIHAENGVAAVYYVVVSQLRTFLIPAAFRRLQKRDRDCHCPKKQNQNNKNK